MKMRLHGGLFFVSKVLFGEEEAEWSSSKRAHERKIRTCHYNHTCIDKDERSSLAPPPLASPPA